MVYGLTNHFTMEDGWDVKYVARVGEMKYYSFKVEVKNHKVSFCKINKSFLIRKSYDNQSLSISLRARFLKCFQLALSSKDTN